MPTFGSREPEINGLRVFWPRVAEVGLAEFSSAAAGLSRRYRGLLSHRRFQPVSAPSAIRSGEDPPNPAEFLDSSPHPRKQAGESVIVPEAAKLKLQARLAFHDFVIGLSSFAGNLPVAVSELPIQTAHDVCHSCASWPVENNLRVLTSCCPPEWRSCSRTWPRPKPRSPS